jgi:hypothetical protein
MSRLQVQADEMMKQHGFMGVPRETFEIGGRAQLVRLLENGLTPESKVLDMGCGCLRVAHWVVRFLDPGCYFGIEPARERVECGLNYLFTPDELGRKRPQFDFNASFDSSVFGTTFDFFLAGSIWTHASKPQIETMLDEFVRHTRQTGVFLASYLPAKSAKDDYNGDQWVGTSHECDTPGVIRHKLKWIKNACDLRGLSVVELPGLDCDSQYWLRIQRE